MRVERAILLADVSGSTALYRSHGDERASQLVFECVEGMQKIATIHGGEFVRSKGDDVLCLFASADSAIAAAGDMMIHGARGEVSLHAGLHWGLVVHRGTEIPIGSPRYRWAKRHVLMPDASATMADSR